MKIAAVSDDGVTISHHFGRAPFYVVVTVEEGQIVARERRDKVGHTQFVHEPQSKEEHDGAHRHEHGTGAHAGHRHTQMATTITDCQVVLSQGMGAGAYRALDARGIQAIVTSIASIDDAVQAYLEGRIVNHIERLH